MHLMHTCFPFCHCTYSADLDMIEPSDNKLALFKRIADLYKWEIAGIINAEKWLTGWDIYRTDDKEAVKKWKKERLARA